MLYFTMGTVTIEVDPGARDLVSGAIFAFRDPMTRVCFVCRIDSMIEMRGDATIAACEIIGRVTDWSADRSQWN